VGREQFSTGPPHPKREARLPMHAVVRLQVGLKRGWIDGRCWEQEVLRLAGWVGLTYARLLTSAT
jgi:hypothetical protein